MGNNQGQNTHSKTHRFTKLPAVPSLARTKDSSYRPVSASSSETALKAAHANDQMTASTSNNQASISEAAQATETVCHNDAIYTIRPLTEFPPSKGGYLPGHQLESSSDFVL